MADLILEKFDELENRDKMIRAQLDLRLQQLEKLRKRYIKNGKCSNDDVRLMQEISREQLQQVDAFL